MRKLRKNRLVHSLMLFAFVISLFTGCGGNSTPANVEPENQEQRLSAERFERWIAAMDPYVRQNPDGTYVLDREAFLQSIRSSDPKTAATIDGLGAPTQDTEVIDNLIASIEAGNLRLAAEKAGGGDDTAGSSCSTHWWGRRCCYWGTSADIIVAAMAMGAIISSFNWVAGAILGAYAWWADYLNDHCPTGGFCISSTWAGGVWLTCR